MQPDEVRQLAKRGLTASIARQLVVQATGLAASIILSRYLTPTDFGLFGLVSLTVQFFTLFAGTGLGIALVRDHSEPSPEDLAAVFTFQFRGFNSQKQVILPVVQLIQLYF